MPRYQPPNGLQHSKTIRILEAKIRALHKAVAALPAPCDCQRKYSPAEEYALAEKLAALWEKDFQQELRTGIRASMDSLDPVKAGRE